MEIRDLYPSQEGTQLLNTPSVGHVQGAQKLCSNPVTHFRSGRNTNVMLAFRALHFCLQFLPLRTCYMGHAFSGVKQDPWPCIFWPRREKENHSAFSRFVHLISAPKLLHFEKRNVIAFVRRLGTSCEMWLRIRGLQNGSETPTPSGDSNTTQIQMCHQTPNRDPDNGCLDSRTPFCIY